MVQQSSKLDEVTVRTYFDLNAAIDSIKFYYNLAVHKGDSIVVEIWREKTEPKEQGG